MRVAGVAGQPSVMGASTAKSLSGRLLQGFTRMTDDDRHRPGQAARILAFRIRPSTEHRARGFFDLGASNLANRLGAPARQGTGHWCSRCKGIWFGYPLEVDCPRCGNRHG